MNKSIDDVRSIGAKYFSEIELKAFIEEIDRLAHNPTSDFFQIIQQHDEVHLEYAAISELMLVDMSLKPTGMSVVVLKARDVSCVNFDFIKKSPTSGMMLTLDIRGTGSQGLKYKATSLESVRRLQKYSVEIQHIISSAK